MSEQNERDAAIDKAALQAIYDWADAQKEEFNRDPSPWERRAYAAGYADARAASDPWVRIEGKVENLPDADVGVLARFKYRTGETVTAIMAHRQGVWFFSDSTGDLKAYMLKDDVVIAWMPIPEYTEDK